MQLRHLEPGRRFRLPLTGKTGTLLRVSEGGATVKYDAGERVEKFISSTTGDEVAFTAPGRSTQISAGTEVEAL